MFFNLDESKNLSGNQLYIDKSQISLGLLNHDLVKISPSGNDTEIRQFSKLFTGNGNREKVIFNRVLLKDKFEFFVDSIKNPELVFATDTSSSKLVNHSTLKYYFNSATINIFKDEIIFKITVKMQYEFIESCFQYF